MTWGRNDDQIEQERQIDAPKRPTCCQAYAAGQRTVARTARSDASARGAVDADETRKFAGIRM